MLLAIDHALTRYGGAASRPDLVGDVGRHALDNEIRRGHLVRLAPEIYARPWSIDDHNVWDVAAVRYASPGAALSHLSAVRRFGLLPIVADDVPVTVSPASRGSRGTVAAGAGRRPSADRRDTALAKLGWQTVRLSHQRLTSVAVNATCWRCSDSAATRRCAVCGNSHGVSYCRLHS